MRKEKKKGEQQQQKTTINLIPFTCVFPPVLSTVASCFKKK